MIDGCTRVWRGLTLVLGILLWTSTASFAQSPNCPAADPDDFNDDSQALQSCLDNNSAVYLEPGNPGYIIGTRLWFNSWNTTLQGVGGKARLKAAPDLSRAILVVDGANNYTISEIIFDGNRTNRTQSSYCFNGPEYAGFYGTNLITEGSGYTLHHIDTINAMCGSGLEAKGENFEIYSVYSADNGTEATSGPWADGVTLVRCDGGYVHGNVIQDNTDISLVTFHGLGCTVKYNTITHSNRYAFAGMGVGGSGSHAGSEHEDNEITSAYDKLGFGLIIGGHPWDTNDTASDAGTVRDNVITGAVVNLAIDGIDNGWVHYNTMSNTQGSRGYNCSVAANYTVAHYGSASIQSGWDAARHYHPGGCGTP